MRRPLGAGQVGGCPWLPLSKRESSKFLDQLLAQKWGGDLESGPLWALFPSPRLGAPWFSSRGLGEGAEYKAAPPSTHGSIWGNSWEGLGPGITRGLKVLEARRRNRTKDSEGKGKNKMVKARERTGRGRGVGRAGCPERSWSQPIPVSLLVIQGVTKWSPGPCWHWESAGLSGEQREDESCVSVCTCAYTQVQTGVPVRGPKAGGPGATEVLGEGG